MAVEARKFNPPIYGRDLPRWEYKTTSPLDYVSQSGEATDCFETSHIMFVLELLGEQGWELAHVVSPSVWIFKRARYEVR